MSMHCFLITIDNADSRNAVVGLIKGNNSILDLVECADEEIVVGPPQEIICNRFRLKQSLLPVGTGELTARAWVGINTGVPAVVRNEYSQNTALWRTIEFGGLNPNTGLPYTRADMQALILLNAKAEDCRFGWTLQPGDSLASALAGNLLAQFVPLF